MTSLIPRPNREGLKPLFCLLIFLVILILFFGATASPAAAKVTDWKVMPVLFLCPVEYISVALLKGSRKFIINGISGHFGEKIYGKALKPLLGN